MKKMNGVLAVLFLFILSVAFKVQAAGATHTITMKSISYDPKELQIKVGDSIEWSNKSYTEHSAMADDETKTFDTGRVQPKQTSKKVTFTKPGTYAYHCNVHGKTMSGKITVVGE